MISIYLIMDKMDEKMIKQCDEAFEKYDTSKNKFIDIAELTNMFKEMASTFNMACPTKTDIETILVEFDTNSDKQLSKEEFRELFWTFMEDSNK